MTTDKILTLIYLKAKLQQKTIKKLKTYNFHKQILLLKFLLNYHIIQKNNNNQLEDDQNYYLDQQEEIILQKLLKNFNIEGSFEKQQLSLLKKQLSSINSRKFQGLPYIYSKLQETLGNYYNLSFTNQYYKDFDQQLSPLIFELIEQICFKLQSSIDPASTYPNEVLTIKCERLQNITQEQLGIQLINFDEQPYQEAINIIKNIGKLNTMQSLEKAIIQSCQSITLEIKKFTTKEVDGDSFIDILMFVIIKAAPKNLLTKIYVFINNLTDEMQNSEANYYATSFLVASSTICQLRPENLLNQPLSKDYQIINDKQNINSNYSSQDYIYNQQQIYQNQYLVPTQPFLIDLQQTINTPRYSQQKFRLLQKSIKLQGYITYICLDFLYEKQIVNKSILIKCNCKDLTKCKHYADCCCIQINENVNLEEAIFLHKKLIQYRNPFYQIQFKGNRQFSILKSVEYLTRHNFKHILFQQPKVKVFATDLMKVALFYLFGCTVQEEQENLQKTLVSLKNNNFYNNIYHNYYTNLQNQNIKINNTYQYDKQNDQEQQLINEDNIIDQDVKITDMELDITDQDSDQYDLKCELSPNINTNLELNQIPTAESVTVTNITSSITNNAINRYAFGNQSANQSMNYEITAQQSVGGDYNRSNSSLESTSYTGDISKITIVQMCDLKLSQQVFQQAYQYKFDFKQSGDHYYLSLCGICRVLLQILSIMPEELPDVLKIEQILDEFSLVDQQFFTKIGELKMYYKFLSLIPSKTIINYILQQSASPITAINQNDSQKYKEAKNLILKLIPKNGNQFIYYEQMNIINTEFYTPRLLQSQIQVVYLLCNALIHLTNYDQQIDIFDVVSLNKLKKQILWYQQANDLQQTGWFNIQTTQNIMIQITQQFYENQLTLSRFSRQNTQ